MIRVAHSIASLAPQSGGTARVARDLTDALSAKDASSTVMLLSQGRSSEGILQMTPGTRVNQSLALSENILSIKAGLPLRALLRDVFAKESVDLLHDHGIWLPCNHHAAVVSGKFRVPLVLHCHGMLEPWALQQGKWKKSLALKVYQRRNLEVAKLIFATAEQEAESIRRLGLRQPIAILPNGVRVGSEIPPVMLGRSSHLAKRNALFLSRIHPKKGLLNLVDAWSKVRPPDWRLRLVGPDEVGHLAEVMRRVRDLGLDDCIEYIGEVEGRAKEAIYCDSDLFVLPSFSENFGVVVAEAMSYGLPVITTRGTPWEGLCSRRCGWWIDPAVDSLASTLREVFGMDAEKLREFGARGREYAREFDWSHIAEQTMEVYDWVLERGPRPACVFLD